MITALGSQKFVSPCVLKDYQMPREFNRSQRMAEQIRRELAKLQASERKARRVTVHENRFAVVLLPGFLLLVLEGLLPEAWIGRRRRRES